MQDEVRDQGSAYESRNGLLVCNTAGVGCKTYQSWRDCDNLSELHLHICTEQDLQIVVYWVECCIILPNMILHFESALEVELMACWAMNEGSNYIITWILLWCMFLKGHLVSSLIKSWCNTYLLILTCLNDDVTLSIENSQNASIQYNIQIHQLGRSMGLGNSGGSQVWVSLGYGCSVSQSEGLGQTNNHNQHNKGLWEGEWWCASMDPEGESLMGRCQDHVQLQSLVQLKDQLLWKYSCSTNPTQTSCIIPSPGLALHT